MLADHAKGQYDLIRNASNTLSIPVVVTKVHVGVVCRGVQTQSSDLTQSTNLGLF